MFTSKIWQHYLYGDVYEVYTDYKSLKYIFINKNPNMRREDDWKL